MKKYAIALIIHLCGVLCFFSLNTSIDVRSFANEKYTQIVEQDGDGSDPDFSYDYAEPDADFTDHFSWFPWSATSDSITLNWYFRTEHDEKIKGYLEQYTGNDTWKKVDGIDYDTSGTVTVEGLKPYKSYGFRWHFTYIDYVEPEYGVSHEEYSDTITVTTRPKQSKIKSYHASKNAVRLNWKKVKCNAYKIQQYNENSGKWISVRKISSNKTTARVKNLRPGKKYRFRIVSYGRVASQHRFPLAKWSKEKKKYITHTAIFAKPSKVVTIKTKK